MAEKIEKRADGTEVYYWEDGKTVKFTRDKNGNEIHYYNDGKTVEYTEDKNGNMTKYYENGMVSYTYDAKTNIKRNYYDDGTLYRVDNLNTGTVTEYAEDGKIVTRMYTENDKDFRSIVFDKGKVKSEYSEKYNGDVVTDVKDVKANYNDDGTLNNWTVKKEDWGERVVDKTTTTYKKDDIKAITSGDVPGYAFIDAHLDMYDNKGEPVWVKESKKKANDKIAAKKTAKTAQKKSTANALKVQKEKQAVKGSSIDNVLRTPWAAVSQKKVVAKTAQKVTTTKTKTTAKKTTKTNGGRS